MSSTASTRTGVRPSARPAGGRRPTPTRGFTDATTTYRAASQGPQLRLTGRMAIVIIIVAALMAGYAGSFRGYLAQRSRIQDLRAEITAKQADIKGLQTDIDRWQDPMYLEQQARERFGYVMPGDVSFVAVNGDGTPITPLSTLTDPSTIGKESVPTLWYDKLWSSVETAATAG